MFPAIRTLIRRDTRAVFGRVLDAIRKAESELTAAEHIVRDIEPNRAGTAQGVRQLQERASVFYRIIERAKRDESEFDDAIRSFEKSTPATRNALYVLPRLSECQRIVTHAMDGISGTRLDYEQHTRLLTALLDAKGQLHDAQRAITDL